MCVCVCLAHSLSLSLSLSLICTSFYIILITLTVFLLVQPYKPLSCKLDAYKHQDERKYSSTLDLISRYLSRDVGDGGVKVNGPNFVPFTMVTTRLFGPWTIQTRLNYRTTLIDFVPSIDFYCCFNTI